MQVGAYFWSFPGDSGYIWVESEHDSLWGSLVSFLAEFRRHNIFKVEAKVRATIPYEPYRCTALSDDNNIRPDQI
jgi:hypothetical protein